MDESTFGIVGLGVMGTALARNFAQKGFSLSLYNRHSDGEEEQVALNKIAAHPELKNAKGFDDLKDFIQSLSRPRKVLLMLTAGPPVDGLIAELKGLLEPGDVLIDGGNSHYRDTQQRYQTLIAQGIYFMGMGISGGETGALEGPSLMPGGSAEAYDLVKPYLESVAATSFFNKSCCQFIGDGGSGHFVKTVHNGIEYAEMQLLAELYYFLKIGMDFTNEAIANCFEKWCKDDYSYLLDITIQILRKKEGKTFVLDTILDVASHKGTGVWATLASYELGVCANMMATALTARQLSAARGMRKRMAKATPLKVTQLNLNLEVLKMAYSLARTINHHQGFDLLCAASSHFNWNLNFKAIADIWTGGCILKSDLMSRLVSILDTSESILQHPNVIYRIQKHREYLKYFVQQSHHAEIALPCFSEAFQFLQLISQSQSAANMIQAQRDFFGAHQYQKLGDTTGSWFHTDW